MGKTALIKEDQPSTVVGGFVLMITPFFLNDVYLSYFNDLFQSSFYKKRCQAITNKSGQAFYNLSRPKLLESLVPLPPLSEQHRIVAKLDELLPKVDVLR